MAFYVFHLPKEIPARAPQAVESLRVVKDGFSWPALIFPLPWLLLNRLWLGAALFFAIYMLLTYAAKLLGASDGMVMLVMFALALFVGLEAGTLKNYGLRKRGFVPVKGVVAKSQEEAELKFFSSLEMV